MIKSGNPKEDVKAKKELMKTIISPIMKTGGFKLLQSNSDIYVGESLNIIFRMSPSKFGEVSFVRGLLKSVSDKTKQKSYVVYLREKHDWMKSKAYRYNFDKVRQLDGRSFCIGTVGSMSEFITNFNYLKTGESFK